MKFSIITKFSIACLTGIFLFHASLSSAFAQNVPSKLQPLKNKADDLLSSYQILPALEIYQKITSEEPGFANCYYNMAICYHELKQFEKAYSALEKFVRLKPRDSEAYFNMGIMQVYLGDNDKARTLLLKARALHPSKDISRRIKNALDHLELSLFPEESLTAIQCYLNQSCQT